MENSKPNLSAHADLTPFLNPVEVKQLLEALPDKPRCPNCGCYRNEDAGCLYCDHPQGIISYRCPYCFGCLSGVSTHGRVNHIEFCRLRHLQKGDSQSATKILVKKERLEASLR